MPLTKAEFINLAKQYASHVNKSHLFPSGEPTLDWLRSFLKRRENLVLKKSHPIEKKRAKLTIEQVLGWQQIFCAFFKIFLEQSRKFKKFPY